MTNAADTRLAKQGNRKALLRGTAVTAICMAVLVPGVAWGQCATIDGATTRCSTTGDATVKADRLSTTGDEAPALDVMAGGRANVTVGTVTTSGKASPAIEINAATGIALTAGAITTAGDESAGLVAQSGGSIALNIANMAIAGNAAAAIDATSNGGDITFDLGSISGQGDGASVSGVSNGGGVSLSVTGTVTTTTARSFILTAGPATIPVPGSVPAAGPNPPPLPTITYPLTGDPARAGIVAVSIAKGATVSSGGNPAFVVDAQKAFTLTNNGTMARTDTTFGRLIEATGGPATIVNSGTMTGTIQTGDGGDTITNSGTWVVSDWSEFGSAFDPVKEQWVTPQPVDTVINTGTIKVARIDGQQYPGFANVEVFRNSGLIDLRSGATGDELSIFASPVTVPEGAPTVLGQYIASGDATIALDFQFYQGTAMVDTVNLRRPWWWGDRNDMSVSGTTKVLFDVLPGSTPKLVNGLPVILVSSGSTGTFVMAQPMVIGGLKYELLLDTRQNAWALYSAPGAAVLRQTKVPTNVQALWHRSSDVVSAHLRDERDRRWTYSEPRSRVWLQAIADRTTRTESYSATINRIAINDLDFSQRQTVYGFQGGVDTEGPENGDTGVVFGVSAGYLQSTAQFRAVRDKVDADAVNFGWYASLLTGSLYVTASATYAHHSGRNRLAEVVGDGQIRGNSYGLRLEGGMRFGSDSLFIEPSASILYAGTSLNRVTLPIGEVRFDPLISNRATGGVRIGGHRAWGKRDIVFYGGAEVVRELAGDDRSRLFSGGWEVTMPTFRQGTFGRGTLGLNVVDEGGINVFAEGQGLIASDYSGGGGRVGVRVSF